MDATRGSQVVRLNPSDWPLGSGGCFDALRAFIGRVIQEGVAFAAEIPCSAQSLGYVGT